MITDDSEIPSLVEEINTRMQELQNYIGDRNIDESRIKFPRGYLRTCEYHREKYAFLRDPVIEKIFRIHYWPQMFIEGYLIALTSGLALKR